MENRQFAFYRKRLGLTQKELAQLLATSIKAIHSYEQGWRNIPQNIERHLYFLLSCRNSSATDTLKCWEVKKCLPEEREKCPAWKFNAGHLCWFITGTICQGVVQDTWQEKIRICKTCELFKSVLEL